MRSLRALLPALTLVLASACIAQTTPLRPDATPAEDLFTYGTYKFRQVQNGREYATYRSESTEPASLITSRKLPPRPLKGGQKCI